VHSLKRCDRGIHRISICRTGERLNGRGGQKEEAVLPDGKLPETEVLVEGNGAIVLGIDDYCEHRKRPAGAQDAPHRVGEKKLSDSVPPPSVVLRTERLDGDSQFGLSEKLAMTLEGRHKLFRWRRGVGHGVEKGVPIFAGEDHAL